MENTITPQAPTLQLAQQASSQMERDKILATLMQTGKRSEREMAFNLIYKRYKTSIFFHLQPSIKNKQDVNDLVQEVFAKVHEKINLYVPDNAFSTWLFTIARNTMIDYKRKKRNETVSFEDVFVNSNDDSDEVAFQVPDFSPTPSDNMLSNERKEAINQSIALGIKSKDSQEVIQMIFIQDMTYEDVAREKNIPLGTVKNLMFRAKAEMQKYFSKNFPDLSIIPYKEKVVFK